MLRAIVPVGVPKAVAQFTFFWKIEWLEFEQLSTKNIEKRFITVFNNVALHFRAELSTKDPQTEADKFGFFIHYDDGPLAQLSGLHCSLDVMKSNKMMERVRKRASAPAVNRGSSSFWKNFDNREATAIQESYGLLESEPFYYQVTLTIPISIFLFSEMPPPPADSAEWSRTFFRQIDDPQKSKFSNVKIISRDGHIFYCHRLLFESQSEALAAMFRHSPVDPSKEGQYDFPTLSTNGTRALLEFLYTGRATLDELSTNDVLEVADAAEQYGLKRLKLMCLAYLWIHVVKKPEVCFDVVRFSDLHQDWKYLKDRAMDVLTENYENLSLHTVDLKDRFGGGETGERFRVEFSLFVYRRVVPCVTEPGAQ